MYQKLYCNTVFDNEAGQEDQTIIILNVTFHAPTFPVEAAILNLQSAVIKG